MDATAIPRLPTVSPPERREPAGQLLQTARAGTPPANTSLPSAPAAPEAAPGRNVTAGFSLDPATRSLVYRVTSTFSGDVLYQFPSDEMLKARAYQDTVERSHSDQAEPLPASHSRSV